MKRVGVCLAVLAVTLCGACSLERKAGSCTLVVINNTHDTAYVIGAISVTASVPLLSVASFAYVNQSSLRAYTPQYSKTIDWPNGTEQITLP